MMYNQGRLNRLMKIYMDNCCYNRIFDDRSIIKNYLEREAVLIIFQKIAQGEMELVGSDVLKIEMSNASAGDRKQSIQKIYNVSVSSEVRITETIKARAMEIQKISNIKAFDSLHLASAENNADVLLTTDQKFLNAARRIANLPIRVENPIAFVMEVISND